jgi:DNA repair protein RadC
VEPRVEKRIPISDMTVGAVPNYVKLTAAIYADGTSAGAPEKVRQLLEQRKAMLAATRELIAILEKAGKDNTQAAALATELKQQADALPRLTRSTQKSQAAINQSAVKYATSEAAVNLGGHSINETVSALRAAEAKLAASKPAL